MHRARNRIRLVLAPGWQQAAFHPSQPGSFAHVDDCVNGAGAWYPAL